MPANQQNIAMTDESPKLPTAPREVIEHIRRYEFGIGASLDAEGRVVVANMQRRYQNLLATVAEDLNSKESHFILELVQNADDNAYGDDADPSLSFSAEKAQLVVVNNELGFRPENVAALCSAGESSKKNKTGYIGEKGIGFKSVFKVTDAPEVHSNGYHFRFNRADQKDLLGYVVPHWKDPEFALDGQSTTLVLPARPGKPFPVDLLKDLDATLLLFLEKLRRLEVKTESELLTHTREDGGPITTLTTFRKPSGGTLQQETKRFFRMSTTYDFSSIHESKREGVTDTDLVLAFPLTEAGEAAPDTSSPIYAFLPIRDFGFPFCIQADFVLISSREGIHEDLEWNITLRDEIAPTFIEALEAFKTTPMLANTYLRFLPEEGAVHELFFQPVIEQLVAELKDAECVPVEGGKWRKPEQVLIAPPEVHALFTSSEALRLFGAEYPSADFDASLEKLRRIGCQQLTLQALVNLFNEHATWFKMKPIEWRAKFYGYLASSNKRADYIKLLKGTACLPTADGGLVSPSQGAVFYPLTKSGKAKYAFEHELTVLDADFYEAALTASPEAKAFFDGLGVQHDNPYTLIRNHILKRHSVGELGDDNDALVGHVRYVKDKLDSYLTYAATLGQSRQAALQVLTGGLLLGTNQEDGDWLWDHAPKLYLSKGYRPVFDIESMLGDKIAPALLVSDIYVVKKRGASAEDVAHSLEAWQRFFYEIGVNDSPKLDLVTERARCSDEFQNLLQSPDNAVRRATLECLDRHWQRYESHQTYMLKVGREYKSFYTPFMASLRATSAPSKRKTSVPLPQAYVNDPAIKSILGGNAVYVDADLQNPQFLAATGVTYKVDASACLKRLEQIRENKGGATRDQVRAIYRRLESLWSAERPVIDAAFSQHALIMVGVGDSVVWVRPKDTCWQPTNVKLLDGAHVPLQSQYSEHRTFFTKQLNVPIELPLTKWVDALATLSEVEDEDDRKSFALTIYRRLSRDLGSASNVNPDWLDQFDSEQLFLNHRGELVAKSDSLFANDVPEYARHFENDESISLLAVPHDHLPGIANLLARTGIPRVSGSLTIEPIGGAVGHVDSALTSKVQDLFGCIARVVYSQSHERFEAAIREQLFSHLRELEVQVVPELELEVTLADVTRTTTGDAAPQGRQLLLRAEAPSHVDHVAMEIRRVLRLLPTQVPTISVLLRSMNLKDAEDYLRVTHVSHLPPEVQAQLDELELKPPSGDLQLELRGEVRNEDPAPQESDQELQDEESAEEVAAPVKHAGMTDHTQVGSAPGATTDSDITRQSAPNTDRERQRTPIAATTTSTPKTLRDTHSTDGPSAEHHHRADSGYPAGNETAPDEAGRNYPHSSTQGTSGVGGRSATGMRGDDSASNSATEAQDGGSRENAGGDGDAYQPANTFQPRPTTGDGNLQRRQVTGTKRPIERTKSGRLLSYTEPAKDSSRAQDDEDEPSPEVQRHRVEIEKAAVDHFIATASSMWRDITVIPNPTNPGFDIQAIAHDGIVEFIEIKGQSGAWTETGVAVSPTQLRKAEEQRERFWLCVVEYATDESRRQLYLIKNPFGLTGQFRFDRGWKGAATVVAARPVLPKEGLFVTIDGEGKARIIGVKGGGQLAKIDYQFVDNRQMRFNKLFKPNTMTLSVD